MSYNNNVLGQSGSIFFFGVIEDNNDPEKLGRVKVRVYGVHNQDKGVLSNDVLPWASVALPVTANESSMPDLYPGTTVFGFFLDGDEMQVPFVTGIVPGRRDSDDKSSLAPHAVQGDRASAKKKSETKLFDEPDDTYAAQYPHNHATVTKSGHVVEYDDTPGAERIHFYHKSGSYIEFLADGRVITKSVGDQYTVTSGTHSVKSTAAMNIESKEGVSLKSGGSGSIDSSGPLSVKSEEAISMGAGSASMGISGSSVSMEAPGGVSSSGVMTAPDVVGGGHSLAAIGAAIAAGGGLAALAGAIGGFAGLALGLAALADQVENLPETNTGGWGSTDMTPPIAPANFSATAGVSMITVSHDVPAFTVGGGYKATHIYMTEWFPGLPMPTLMNAGVAHSFSGTVSSFPAEPGKKYVVWAKWESKAGVFGEPSPDELGVVVETGQDVALLTELIRQEILDGDLYQHLVGKLGIDTLAESVSQNIAVTQQEINRRRADLKAEQQARIDGLVQEALLRGAEISEERVERQTALESVAGVIQTITAAVDNNAAAIQEESIVRATAIEAEAELRETLVARVGAAEGHIISESIVRANETEAISARLDSIQSEFEGNIASVSDDILTIATENSALASRIETVSAEVADNKASVDSSIISLVNADYSLATQINSLEVEFANNNASISTTQQTFANALNAFSSEITSLEAIAGSTKAELDIESSVRADETGYIATKYAVNTTVTSGGRTVVGGFGLMGTSDASKGPTIDFGVVADRFWIGAPTGVAGIPDSVPFVVQATPTTINGVSVPAGVYIEDAFIKNGTITNAKIADAAIDNAKIANLDATKITSGFIDADRINAGDITADKLTVDKLSVISSNLGNITAGSIDINSATASIDEAGNALFRSLEVIGPDGTVHMSVKPVGASFTFPEVVGNVPEYINNDSLYIDADGNLSSSISRTPSDPQSLIDYSVFTVGETLPVGWSERSDPATETSVIETTGPKGIPTLVMRAFTQDSASTLDGGYGSSPPLIPIPGKTYRFIQPIKRVSATVSGTVYFGPGPAFASPNRHINANGTANSNPYWNANSATTFPVGEWCFVVGYLFPFGSVTPVTIPDDAGLYKVSDGSKIGSNTTAGFILTSSGETLGYNLRSFVDSATGLNEEFHFGVPFAHEVDGTEPAITSIFKGTNLRTMGFAGDYDATKGAPAGTLVNGIPVEDVTTVVADFDLQNNRNGAAISVSPVVASNAITHSANADGSVDISLQWTWGGTVGSIDGFLVYVYSAATNAAYTFGTSPAQEMVVTVPANKTGVVIRGVAANNFYTFGINPYRAIDPDVVPDVGAVFSGGNIFGTTSAAMVKQNVAQLPYQPSTTVAITSAVMIAGTSASTIAAAATNFNLRNDRNNTIPSTLTFPAAGQTLDHTVQDNGSVDISFEWVFADALSSIDGFRVYVRQHPTDSAAYALGTDPKQETVYELPASKTAFVLYGVSPTAYYTFGVQAYRVVDNDAALTNAVNGIITSAIAQSTVSGENPYQPSTSIAFKGDITGTIGGSTPTSTVLTNSANGQVAFTGTVKYRTPGTPTNSPVPTAITQTDNSNGSRNIRLDWAAYTQGTNPADFLIIFWNKALPPSVPGNVGVNDSSAMFNVNTTGPSYYIFEGISYTHLFKFGIAAARRTENGIEIGSIVSPDGTASTPNWQSVGSSTPNFTGNINGTPAATVSAAATNFNNRNDTNTTDVVAPTIPGGGISIDHVPLNNGSVDISFEWFWSGDNKDIDGFRVYIYKAETSGAYLFSAADTPTGTRNRARETVYEVPADKRAFVLAGVSPTSYYTFGVQAYRVVDFNVSATGIKESAIVQSLYTTAPNSEHPFRPSTSVAFVGDISGTINTTPTTTVVTNATNGASAFSQTTNYRITSAPNPSTMTFGTITDSATIDGNIVVNVPYNFIQGSVIADQLYLFYSEGHITTNPTPTVTSASPSMATNPVGGSMNFTLKPNTPYRFGIQAVRRIDTGVVGNTILQSSVFTTEALPNFLGAVAGTPATDVNNFTKLTQVPYSTIFNNEDSTALGYNPAFAAWSIQAGEEPTWGTGKEYPTGWSKWAGSDASITKETNSTFVRVGASSVKMVSAATSTPLGISRQVSLSTTPFAAGTFLNGTVDLYMTGRTAGLPGVLIRLYTDAGFSVGGQIDTHAQPLNTQQNTWHRIPWTARLPNSTSQIYGIRIFLMASWDGWVGTTNDWFVGTVYFDNMRFMLADKTTDNIQLNLTETTGTLSLVNGGTGTVTTITPNNKIGSATAPISSFFNTLSITDAYIGNVIKSTNYEMYNLIRDFVSNPASNYTVTTGSGLTLVTGPVNVTGANGAVTGYTAVRAAWTGTAGGGYLSSIAMPTTRKAVSAGEVVEAHVYVQCLFGTARLLVSFYNAAGSNLSTTLVSGGGGTATMAAATGTLSQAIANFSHLSGFITAPANAVSMMLVVQVARTVTTGNTDCYVNIPSLAIVMDSATAVHTWPSTSGLGGAGWILNKTSGLEINAANVRGKLTTDQIQVGAATNNTTNSYVLQNLYSGGTSNGFSGVIVDGSILTITGQSIFCSFSGWMDLIINTSSQLIFNGRFTVSFLNLATLQYTNIVSGMGVVPSFTNSALSNSLPLNGSGGITTLTPGEYQAKIFFSVNLYNLNGSNAVNLTNAVVNGNLFIQENKV